MKHTSWRLALQDGSLVPVRVADGTDVQVGQAQQELARAPGSSSVVLLEGDGGLDPQPLSIDFLARGLDAEDHAGALEERYRLEAALRQPTALWGAKPFEGMYLQLLRANAESVPLNRPVGQFRMPYSLIPASVARGELADGWRYPILDDVSEADKLSVSFTNEHAPDAPILGFRNTSDYSTPLGFSAMPQGTMFVGAKSESTALWVLGAIGAPPSPSGIVPAYGSGIFYSAGSYIGYAAGVPKSVRQDDAGGFGRLVRWALTFASKDTLTLYSASRLGFVNHGSVSIGEVEPLPVRRAYLGTRGDGVGVNGVLMPGMPRFGTPFFSHRVWPEAEVRTALLREYEYAAQFSSYTIPPPPPGLNLIPPSPIPELVVGRQTSLVFALERTGGFLGDLEAEVDAGDPSIRATASISEDDQGESELNVLLTVEEGARVEAHELTGYVRAVGQDTDLFLQKVIAPIKLALTVRSGVPAIADGALSHTPIIDAAQHRFSELLKDATGLGKVWQLRGLAHFTSRGDGIYCDGSNIAPYGQAFAFIDSLVDMTKDWTNAVAFADVDRMPVGTVLFGVASMTSRGHYFYAYKASATTLKVRTSLTTTADSGGTLPISNNVMDLAARIDKTAGTLTLMSTKTAAKVVVPALAWTGRGRLCAFGLLLSDGTVQGVSVGAVLAQATHQRVVSDVQLERQAEFMRGSMLRTARYARGEYASSVRRIWEPGDNGRNRHPATAGEVLFKKGSGASFDAGGWRTNGDEDTIVRTPFMANTNGNDPHDSVFILENLYLSTSRGAGNVVVGLQTKNDLNAYARFYGSSTFGSRGALTGSSPGEPFETVEATGSWATGKRGYSARINAAQRRWEFEDIASGETLRATFDTFDADGEFLYSFGASYRGYEGTILRGERQGGAEFEGVSRACGLLEYGRVLTAAEKTADSANLRGTYDYTNLLTGTGDSTSTGVPVARAGADQSTPVGQTVTLDARTSTGAFSYRWTLTRPTGSAAVLTDASSPVATFDADVAGTYTAEVTVTNTLGSSRDSVSVRVTTGTPTPPIVTPPPGGLAITPPKSSMTPVAVNEANFSLDAFGPVGDERRTLVSDVRTWLASLNDTNEPLSKLKKVPADWNPETDINMTTKKFPTGSNGAVLDAYRRSGQYHICRTVLSYPLGLMPYIGATRDVRGVDMIYRIIHKGLNQTDYRGKPDSVANPLAPSSRLGIIYGDSPGGSGVYEWFDDAKTNIITGKRLHLESGVGSGGWGAGAYVLWLNRDVVSPSGFGYLAASHRARAYLKNHLLAEYNDIGGNTYLFIERKMTHPDASEMLALAHLALIETDMFKLGLTAPVTVSINGGATETVSLHSSTTADVKTHAYWIRAERAVRAFVADSNSYVEIPTSAFRDQTMINHGPAAVWGQISKWGPSTQGQFVALTRYFNESGQCYRELYMCGLLASAFGTQAAADAFMVKLCSMINVAMVPPGRPALKMMPDHMGGIYRDSTGTIRSRSFTTRPIVSAGDAYDDYRNVDGNYLMHPYDPTRRIARTVLKGDHDAQGRPKGRMSIALLADLIWWNGRVGQSVVTPTATGQATPSTNKLTWAPPVLTNPTTISTVPGSGVYNLTAGLDYILNLGSTPITRALAVNGGRNVVIIGGEVAIPDQGATPSISSRRGIKFQDQTGTVHIEGVLFRGDDISEGIQITAKQAIVQIQNCRIENIHARDQVNFSDNHPDLVQTYGSVGELRIDKFTGSTDYQGFLLQPDNNSGPHGPTIIKRTNIVGLPTSRYLFWMNNRTGWTTVQLSDFYCDIPPERTLGFGKSLYPDTGFADPNKLLVETVNGQLRGRWPNMLEPVVTGYVIEGSPPAGDFVPQNTVGIGYVSPGYI